LRADRSHARAAWRTLILVHREQLLEQWRARLSGPGPAAGVRVLCRLAVASWACKKIGEHRATWQNRRLWEAYRPFTSLRLSPEPAKTHLRRARWEAWACWRH
jgi:hypothetical protein